MTFDELYNSIMEQGPGLTVPSIPKLSLQAPGGQQTINTPTTSSASTTTQKTTTPNTPQSRTVCEPVREKGRSQRACSAQQQHRITIAAPDRTGDALQSSVWVFSGQHVTSAISG